jgi:hypothetical protein
MSPRMQTAVEVGGFAAAVLGVAGIGYVAAGVALAIAFGLLALAAVLIFAGNV